LAYKPSSTRRVHSDHYSDTTLMIVGVEPHIRQLVADVSTFLFVDFDEKLIIRHFLNAIKQERRAKEEIEYSVMEILADYAMTDTAVSPRKMGNVFKEFGTHLLNEMIVLGAYNQGFLNWKFHEFIGNDIVMVRRVNDHDVV